MTIQINRYWKCQLIGWSIATGTNFLLQMLRPDSNWVEQLIANLSFAVAGIAGTQALRVAYQRLRIVDMSLLQMLLPVLALSLLTTTIIICSMFSLIVLIQLQDVTSLLNPSTLLGNLIGIYPLILIWSSLYLGSHYLWRWRQAEVEKLELANALKDAQLNTLIGQINPHFMFNALNNIRALMLENVPRARDSLTLLAKVLRYGLTAPKQSLVSLQEELDTVNDFVQLASIQYENRLQWQAIIDVPAGQFSVPPMMIQMLVENAIKHGIAQRKNGGRLRLHIQQQQQHLCIELVNDGCLTRQPYAEESTQLGLENIAQRLNLLYNGLASFKLQQHEQTVVAQLRLPLTH
jgi:two-component system, LytTR family, sensor kinase